MVCVRFATDRGSPLTLHTVLRSGRVSKFPRLLYFLPRRELTLTCSDFPARLPIPPAWVHCDANVVAVAIIKKLVRVRWLTRSGRANYAH